MYGHLASRMNTVTRAKNDTFQEDAQLAYGLSAEFDDGSHCDVASLLFYVNEYIIFIIIINCCCVNRHALFHTERASYNIPNQTFPFYHVTTVNVATDEIT